MLGWPVLSVVGLASASLMLSACFGSEAGRTEDRETGDREYNAALTQETKLSASDAAARDRFGRSVAIAGDTVVVGTPRDDEAGRSSGAAYVFTRSGTTWAQEAKLTASDAAAKDRLGRRVAIAGDTVVVGAAGDDDAGSSSGAAYVFTRSSTTWTEAAKLTASDGAAGERSGRSVAIAGDTVVVGTPRDDEAGSTSGAAYVFSPPSEEGEGEGG